MVTADIHFWWVNHKQSHKYEISKGLLWSPQVKSNGARSHFYDNMRKSRPGDFIVSMANARVSNIGQVTDYAVPASRPSEYTSDKNDWSQVGWLLPVAWKAARMPIKVSEHIDDLRDHLPEKYSPIQSKNGHGNQGAYLSEISSELFNTITGLLNVNLDFEDVLTLAIQDDEIDDLTDNIPHQDLDDTNKDQVSKARRGQGVFRKNLEKRMSSCPFTGVSDRRFLTASHIKPWRVCISAEERLTGDNGLLLTAHIDKLFDKGFISISKSGKVLISKEIPEAIISKLSLKKCFEETALMLNDKQSSFMDYHRENVFLK